MFIVADDQCIGILKGYGDTGVELEGYRLLQRLN